MGRGYRKYIPEDEYNKRYRNAQKFSAGDILPESKVTFCRECGDASYITSSNPGVKNNYRALAIKTDKGYVAVPFAKGHATTGLFNNDGHYIVDNGDGTTREVKTECHRIRNESGFKEARDTDLLGKIKSSATDEKVSDTPAPASTAPTDKSKGFANKYAGNCVGCNTRVGVGEGLTSRGATGWEVRCVGCHHG